LDQFWLQLEANWIIQPSQVIALVFALNGKKRLDLSECLVVNAQAGLGIAP